MDPLTTVGAITSFLLQYAGQSKLNNYLKVGENRSAFENALRNTLAAYRDSVGEDKSNLADALLLTDGPLFQESVRNELVLFLEVSESPNISRIASVWSDAVGEIGEGVNFESETKLLLKILKIQLHNTENFRDYLTARDVHDIAEKVSIFEGLNSINDFPTEIVDQKIEECLITLRQSRFFHEFDQIQYALIFARRLIEGDLARGSDIVRGKALAWCVRCVAYTDELERGKSYLDVAKGVASCQEVDIAGAFISSSKNERSTALRVLASLDSSASKSAALLVVLHHDDAEQAIDWMKSAGINVVDLDPDGKLILLAHLFELSRWEGIWEVLDAIDDEDLNEAPALHQMVAMANLVRAVPEEYRNIVTKQPPFDASSFKLASDAVALNSRKVAHEHFIKAVKVAQSLNFPKSATINDDYALWLELRSPDNSGKGKQRLESKLRDPKTSLRLVHLGLQFGIELDLSEVAKEIERQIAQNFGITVEAATARFALAFTQETPEEVANYIAHHFEELSEFFDKKSLCFLQIEAYSKAGLPKKAIEILNSLIEKGLSAIEEKGLRRIIAESEGEDPVEARKAQYHLSQSLCDLEPLVHALEKKGDWEGACNYCGILFDKTHSLRDAERYVNALSNAHKTEDVIKFVSKKNEFLEQSPNIHLDYCWALYEEGRLLETSDELVKLGSAKETLNYRALFVNLCIAMGDWKSLSTYVAEEYQNKDKRSAHELMSAARLAFDVDSPHAKELLFAAANKGKDDAGVLAIAYGVASSAGWEDSEEVTQWLHKASELSGDEGPVQRVTLNDLYERKQDWDRHESDTWKTFSKGGAPIFMVAQYLNRSLIDLTLHPALVNNSERDPRRRGIVSAFSGARQPVALKLNSRVGLDATTLLTLDFLGLLDKAFEVFESIFIPHPMLGWLFEEKQKASFHQPSRIRHAHQLQHLLAMGVVEKLVLSTVADSELCAQVGDELAMLISEANKDREGDRSQYLVVRPAPVHRIGSVMKEEADLTEFDTVISSCRAIVERLGANGQISADEEKIAYDYLKLHEKPWPNQPDISDGATLYLDDLTVTYFSHLGLLEKLHSAGFRLVISSRKVTEAAGLVSYEKISTSVLDSIERIRHSINLGIESGKVIVGKLRDNQDSVDFRLSKHPTVGVIALAGKCDAIISDDRFLNQHSNIGDEKVQSPLYTTLDFIIALFLKGYVSNKELNQYFYRLRRAGYLFVPILDEELQSHLEASSVKGGELKETAELRAIRENLLRARMSDWLQLPKEAFWLDSVLNTLIRVMKRFWGEGLDLSVARACFDWVLNQLDLRGWAHRIISENTEEFVSVGRGTHILMLVMPPQDVSEEVQREYWSWVEERVLEPIKEQFPDLYTWMIAWQKKEFSKLIDMNLSEEGIYDK